MKIFAFILFVLMYILMIAKPAYRPFYALSVAAIFLLSGILPPDRLMSTINWNVLLMMSGTMIIVYYFIDSHMPSLLADILLKKSRNFMWVTDFRLPTTNNLSERSLRFTKIHEKVSGQFESVDYARHFAKIRTYLETCARNGINEFDALLRLTQDNPFSLSEVLSWSGS